MKFRTTEERTFIRETVGKGRREKICCFYIEVLPETPIENVETAIKKVKDHWDWVYRDTEGKL